MTIDDKLLTYLETLSRLKLSEAERENSKIELAKILDFMSKLDEVDTSSADANADLTRLAETHRKDEVFPSSPRNDILANAISKTEEAFKVPKTVD